MIRRAILAVALLSGGMVLADPAGALAQALPTDRSDLAYSYAPLVKRVSPAVVNIYTTTTARVQRRLPFPFPGMPQAGERVQNSLGSGVLVRPDGLIVTNAHVVKGADEIRVVLADRREFDAKVVTQDERYDLALLRIDGSGEKFPFLEMRDSDSIEVGDVVLAIGNPFGLNQTVTSGIISALARSAGGVNDFELLHPDRCRHQSRQFRRRAGQPRRPPDRHQHRDLFADRRIGRHRLRHPVQHRGAHRLDRRAGRPHRAAVARHQHAAGDARHRRRASTCRGRPAWSSRKCFPTARATHAGLKRNDVIIALQATSRSTTRRACGSAWPRCRSIRPCRSRSSAAARSWCST